MFVDFWNLLAGIPGASALGITRIGDKVIEPHADRNGVESLHPHPHGPAEARLTVDMAPGLRMQLEYLHRLHIVPGHVGDMGAPNPGPTTARP
jgi:hypothetical protein